MEVNIEDFETQKENIQPISTGRKATILSSLYKDTSVSDLDRINNLNIEKSRIESTLDIPCDDPLSPYYQFVEWMQQRFPTGHSDILTTVERAVRHFRKLDRYKNDKRHLKLWLIVLSKTKEPLDVFKYLVSNGIGQKLSLFYLEYSSFMQSKSRIKEAEEILLTGIEMDAEPVEPLRIRLDDLRKGICVAQIPWQPNTILSSNTSNLHSSRHVKSKSGIQVFKDQETSDKIELFPEPVSENGLNEFGSLHLRKKENEMPAQMMQGSTFPQNPPIIKKEEFKVFKDETFYPEKIDTIQRKEVLVCDLSLVYMGDDEFSFEEIRALTQDNSFDDEEDEERYNEPSPVKEVSKRVPLSVKSTPLTTQPLCRKVLPGQFDPKNIASPTINTKAALADVFEMFSAPLEGEEEDVTISSKVYKPFVTKPIVFSDDLATDEIDQSSSNQFPPLQEQFHELQDANEPEPSREHTRSLNRFPRNYFPMTPITELSHEDQTSFSGISTIGSHSSALRDDDHTVLTLADKTISDRTFDKFGYSLQIGNSLIADPSNFETNDPIHDAIHDNILSNHEYENDSEAPEDLKENHLPRPQTPAKSTNPVPIYDQDNLTQFPNPCDPRSKSVYKDIISITIPILKRLPSLTDSRHTHFEMTPVLEKYTLLEKKTRSSAPVIKLNRTEYRLVKKLGRGGFGTIYLFETEVDLNEQDSTFYAIKVQPAANPWEFYILKQIEERLPPRLLMSIVDAYSCHIYGDSLLTCLEYYDQGTLLDCVNIFKETPLGGIDELLAMFFASEMLRVVEGFHACGILHGDLKADNILLRVRETEIDGKEVWDTQYSPRGDGGWDSKASIDMKLFPKNQQFLSSPIRDPERAHIDAQTDCWEYRNDHNWTFEVDWYGLASILHVLLHGRNMQVSEDREYSDIIPHYDQRTGDNLFKQQTVPHISLQLGFKRYWQTELWTRLFDLLLNSGVYNQVLLQSGQTIKCESTESDSIPITDLSTVFPLIIKIRELRHDIENWLVLNCNKSGKSLKSCLRRIQVKYLENE